MNSQYKPQLYNLLEQSGKDKKILPESLQILIDKFEQALNAAEKSEGASRQKWFKIIAQTDAIISADIQKIFGSQPAKTKIDKMKLLELKAKALRLQNS